MKIELSKELALIIANRLLPNEINLQNELLSEEQEDNDYRFVETRRNIINECLNLINIIKGED